MISPRVESADLAAKVRWAADHPHEMAQMGANARAEYDAKYTAEINYKQLMAIYERAMEVRGKMGNGKWEIGNGTRNW